MAKITAALFFLLIAFQIPSLAQLSVTPATNDGCPYQSIFLDDIIISEGSSVTDFNIDGTSRTFLLEVSGGASLVSAGSVAYSHPGVSVNISLYTSTVLEVTIYETSPGHETTTDYLTISGVEVTSTFSSSFDIHYFNSGTLSVGGWTGSEPVAYFNTHVAPVGVNDTPLAICSTTNPNYDLQNNVNTGNAVSSTFTWTVVAGPNISGAAPGGGPFINDILTNSGNVQETAVYTVTPTNDTYGCVGTTFDVTIVVDPLPNGGNDPLTICAGTDPNYDLQGNVNLFGNSISSTFSWTIAPDPTISGATSNSGTYINNILTNSSTSAANVVYTVTPISLSSGCFGPTFDVTVTVEPLPAGFNDFATICSGNGPNYDLQANVNFVNGITSTFTWTVVTGPNISGASNNSGGYLTDILTNSGSSTETATYTITPISLVSGCVGDPFDVTINVDPEPSASVPGSNILQCGTFTNLAATYPTVGTGTWTSNPTGGLTIIDPADPSSGLYTVNENSSYLLTWTITNGVCPPSASSITVDFQSVPSAADAGIDQTICATNTTLGATSPISGTGSWSILSGNGGLVANSPDPTSPFSGVDGETYILRWTVTTASCGSTFDDVQITMDEPPTSAFAGTDDTVCSGVYPLSGNAPTVGTGAWAIVSATTGYFDDLTQYNTNFNGTTGETHTLSWTVSNGVCAPSVDYVTITMETSPTTAFAGIDQDLCNTGANLTANIPAVGAGIWTASGPGTFSDATDPYATFTASTGVYTLTWTVSNGSCIPSADDVLITLQDPAVVYAGADQSVCGNSAVPLSGTYGGGATSVTWSTSGTGSFDDFSSPLSNYTPSAGDILLGTVTLTLTTNDPDGAGLCASATDDVTITLENPATVNAGPDATGCGTIILSGSFGGSATIAQWSTTGDGSFDDIYSLTPEYGPGPNDISNGFVTLTLTTDDPAGGCSPVFDNVVITIIPGPTVDAGADQTVCGDTQVSLAGAYGGTASFVTWSTSGTGSFDNINITNAVYTPSANDILAGTVTLTITTDDPDGGGPCTVVTDQVVITLDPPATANAGPDQTICSGSTVSIAGLIGGSASSSVWIPTGDGSFDDPNSGAAVYTPGPADLSNGNVTFTFSTDDPAGICNATSDNVFITISPGPTTGAGGDQTVCGSSTVSLSGTYGGTASFVTWTTSGSGSFDNINLTNPVYTPSYADQLGGVVTLTITTDDPDGAGLCVAAFDDVTITLDPAPTANAGPDDAVCVGTNVFLAGLIGGGESTGFWTTSGDGTFDDPNSLVAAYTPGTVDSSNASVILTLHSADPAGACSSVSDDMTVTFYQPPTTADAGADITYCGSGLFMAANTPLIGIGSWSEVATDGGNAFADYSDPGSHFSGTPGVVYVMRWTITNGPGCPDSFDDVQITFDATPSVAAAGADSTVCGTSLNLASGAPAIGTGAWTASPAGGSFSSTSDPNALFTGTIGVSYTLTWTISNGTCSPSYDDVIMTFDQAPTAAAAGPDQTICGNNIILGGNSPSIGTGTWSVITGNGGESIANAPDPNSPFSGDFGFTYTLRWTTSNGACNSYDDVQITFDQSPSAANAGVDQTVCGPSANLSADTPTVGTGTWSADSAGTFSSVSDPNATFTGTPGLSYTLTWTVSNGACSDTTDTVLITLEEAPTTASAGVDQTICGTTASLSANTPSVGTGTWFVDGTAFVANSTDPNTTLTGTKDGIFVLTWSVFNGSCPASADTVVIQMDAIPDVANAGADQSLCDSAAYLAANAPTAGTGKWTVVPGDSTMFANTMDPFTTFTGVPGTTYTLTWTISSGSCAPSSDDVIVTIDGTPTTANAGADQTVCSVASLVANTPVTGSGSWSASPAGGAFSNSSAPNATFTAPEGVTYTLTWTISGGGICAASTDDVLITFEQSPTTSNAGPDQNSCSTSVNLAANTPGVGTGVWTASPAGGSFSSDTDPNATFTGTTGVSYALTWSITSGSCPASADTVVLTIDPLPTAATAGGDQTICESAGATLSANSPAVGAGQWSALPAGGSFSNLADPNASFTAIAGVYTLTWSITASCAVSSDSIVVTVDQLPSASAAGGDQAVCGPSATLSANIPTVGTGFWTSAPPGTFSNQNDPASTFSAAPGTYTLTWTVANGLCGASSDDVVVSLADNPSVANAGPDNMICGTSVFLNANIPVAGTGSWNLISGPAGSFTDPADPFTMFDGVEAGTYLFTWTIANGCGFSRDTTTIIMNAVPSGTDATFSTCSDSPVGYDLQNNINSQGSNFIVNFSWLANDHANIQGESTSAASGAIINDVLINTTNIEQVINYTVTPTTTVGCTGPTFSVEVTVFPLPILNSGLNSSTCSGNTVNVALDVDPSSTPGVTYNIISINSGTLTPAASNIAPGPGYVAGSIAADVFTTPPVTSDNVIYTVAPVSIDGCQGPQGTVTVAVNPLPDLTVDNQSTAISSGDATNIILTSTLPGATFTYLVAAPPPITGAANGSINPITQTLVNSSTGNQVVSYSVTAISAEGCLSPAQPANVVIFGVADWTVITSDSVALVAFYNATGGPQWTNSNSWLSGDVNTWPGVIVANQRVTGLLLPGNNLTGIIPQEIGALDAMTNLDLSDNDLTGQLPATFTTLPALQTVDVSNNGLTGAIPALPPGLQNADFSTNLFESLTTISDFVTVIDVSSNKLVELGDLTGKSLATLKTENNNLTFEDLELNTVISNFTYAPQDTVEQKLSLLVQLAATQNFIATIGGSSNVYQWHKNGSPIAGNATNTLTLTNITLEDDAIYHYTATSPLVAGLTLVSQPIQLKVSSLERDSIALLLLYEKTNGDSWTNKANWLTTPLGSGTWAGVSVANNRVTALDLSANNLAGGVPASIADIENLQAINLSNNQITSLPDLSSMALLTSLNVSVNKLDFGSLEPNVAIPGFVYSSQAILGTTSTVYLAAGDSYTFDATSPGLNNQYQWKHNGSNVTGATQSILQIPSIARDNMGAYECHITNSTVTQLTLRTAVDTVFAVSNLTGTVFIAAAQPAVAGTVTLYKVTTTGAFDLAEVTDINADGSFQFSNVILGDYQLLGFADTLQHVRALPTYYKNTIYWEEADTIEVDANVTPLLDIMTQFEPESVPAGQGVITGYVEEDTDDGRVKAPKRVANAGVSVRRVEGTGRDKEEVLTLYSYVLTDENGEFSFFNLPVGDYRLNIQYPGYPMDPNSFVTIPIGEDFESEKRVEAVVEAGKIVVNELVITHVWSLEDYEADLYPNPSTSYVNFRFARPSVSRAVNLYDLNGKKLIQMNAGRKEERMDVRELSAGTYFINIHDHGMMVKTFHLIIE
jgi:Leucine-rich repeat (LRR) protein